MIVFRGVGDYWSLQMFSSASFMRHTQRPHTTSGDVDAQVFGTVCRMAVHWRGAEYRLWLSSDLVFRQL